MNRLQKEGLKPAPPADKQTMIRRWRDWVIGAYNRNKPYDQFTVQQIARGPAGRLR